MKMRPFGRLITPESARRRLLQAATPVTRVEEMGLASAVGRVTSDTVRATTPVPAFARATWDGYAFPSASTRRATKGRPVELAVVGEIYAEEQRPVPLTGNEAVAIATGGAIPRGADTVAIFEKVRVVGDRLYVDRFVPRGRYVALPGTDLARGTVVVRAGEVLGPAALGGLAAVGRRSVRVYERPRVTIIPNGNELLALGAPPRRGMIHETNNVTLGALAQAAGATVRTLPPVRDDPTKIERAIRRALSWSDLVLVTGGSSVGEHDFLPAIFPQVGRLLFHGISVRPGKPTLAAVEGRRLLVGMPGHPTSCLANGFWLLLPLLRRLGRLPGFGWVDAEVRMAEGYDAPSPGFSTVIPLRVVDGWGYPTFRDSSAITSLAGANGFAIASPGSPALRRGTHVGVHLLLPPVATQLSSSVKAVA